jgi:hypothetical protein
MRTQPALRANEAPAADLLAIHVMGALTTALRRGQTLSLDDLSRTHRARRAEVRRVVSTLHAQGFVDALRMRPTMLGLTVGLAVSDGSLRPLRPSSSAAAFPTAA